MCHGREIRHPRVAETYGRNAECHRTCRIRESMCSVSRDIPFLKQYDTKIIVNVCGRSVEDYCEVVERLADETGGSCWRSISPARM